MTFCQNRPHDQKLSRDAGLKMTSWQKHNIRSPDFKMKLTSCMIISFWDNVASRPLCCTTSRFCHRLRERALFLSCSWTTGGDVMVDPGASSPLLKLAGRFSRCRLCSISCCLDVSRYSWYRNAGELREVMKNRVPDVPPDCVFGPATL